MRIVRASLKYLLPVIPARENANSDVFKKFGVVPGEGCAGQEYGTCQFTTSLAVGRYLSPDHGAVFSSQGVRKRRTTLPHAAIACDIEHGVFFQYAEYPLRTFRYRFKVGSKEFLMESTRHWKSFSSLF